jgi:hypothetical protein
MLKYRSSKLLKGHNSQFAAIIHKSTGHTTQTHVIYNTPPWMNTHKEYTSLKPCQGKTQWKKTNDEGKRVQYSCVFFSAFKIVSLKPCKEKPYGKKP